MAGGDNIIAGDRHHTAAGVEDPEEEGHGLPIVGSGRRLLTERGMVGRCGG